VILAALKPAKPCPGRMHLPPTLDSCGSWSSGSIPDTSSCVGYSTYPASPAGAYSKR
jgi:hypothetical protein